MDPPSETLAAIEFASQLLNNYAPGSMDPEVIAMNHLLRYSGVNAAEAFNERLLGRMKTAAANNIREYLQEDHE